MSLELRTLNCAVDSKKSFKFFFLNLCCDLKAFITTLNRVWTRVKGPILGLLLLLSVIPLLSDNREPINQVKSAKVSSKEDTNMSVTYKNTNNTK